MRWGSKEGKGKLRRGPVLCSSFHPSTSQSTKSTFPHTRQAGDILHPPLLNPPHMKGGIVALGLGSSRYDRPLLSSPPPSRLNRLMPQRSDNPPLERMQYRPAHARTLGKCAWKIGTNDFPYSSSRNTFSDIDPAESGQSVTGGLNS